MCAMLELAVAQLAVLKGSRARNRVFSQAAHLAERPELSWRDPEHHAGVEDQEVSRAEVLEGAGSGRQE